MFVVSPVTLTEHVRYFDIYPAPKARTNDLVYSFPSILEVI